MNNQSKTPKWVEKHYAFFQNTLCEYFPCHEIEDIESFNCLFCYCPLFALGDRCGGNFSYTEKGDKNCMNCIFPHKQENYGKVLEKYPEIREITKKHEIKS